MSAFVINPYRFAAAGIEAEYLHTLGPSSIITTTFTYQAEDIGTADANRRIVLCCSNRHGFGVGRVTAVSVGGSSATVALSEQNAIRRFVAIFYVDIAAGTQADIAITTNGAVQNICTSVFRVVAPSFTLEDTAFAFSQTSPVSQNLNVTSGGIAFLTCSSGTGNAAYDAPTSSDIASSFEGTNQAHGFALTSTTETDSISITHPTQVINYGLASFST